jgi:phosphatidylglycerophosphate synthase
MKKIPLLLTVLRLFLGQLAVIMALGGAQRKLFGPVLLAGMLSDYFDGVAARRLGVSTTWLRRFDSMADVLFYACVLCATWIVSSDVVVRGVLPLGLLLISEFLCIGVSLVRFRKLPATHCYSAKAYGLTLFLAFMAVLSCGYGHQIFWVTCVVGLLANAEVIAILLVSRRPPVDVPSIFMKKTAAQSNEPGQNTRAGAG